VAQGQVFEISKAVTFEAAHYMDGKPEGHPYRAIHGHSFRLEATVAEIGGLEVPTLESLCLWAAADLKPRLPGLSRVAMARPSLNERCELVLQRG